MRKIFVILSVFMATIAYAAPISKEQAMEKAAAFLSEKNPTSAQRGMRMAAKADRIEEASDEAYYYIFNVGDNNGFVIVSGDDHTESILGYSDEGSFDPNSIPENMKFWLEGYAQQLKALANMSEEQAERAVRAPRKTRVVTRNSIAPLITTKWDQATPYWNMCPQFMVSDDEADGYDLAYTGCVATSMSQIMYFHKQPAKLTKDIPSYTFTYSDGNYNYATVEMEGLSADGSEFDWEHMRETYTGAEDEVYTNAVAKLMFYVGCSVKMQYGTSSSGAYTDDIPTGFTYFGYGSKIAFRTDYTQDTWDDLVYSELAAGRPMIYNGTAGSGGGHSFICDGFEYGNYFHINWGWGGMGNGYFQLAIMNPQDSGIGGSSSSEGYNMKQNIIYNIIPGTAEGGEEGGEEEEEPALTATNIDFTSTSFDRDSKSDAFKIYKSKIVKISYSDHSGTGKKFKTGLALYDPTEGTYTMIPGTDSYLYSTVTTSALGDTRKIGDGVYSNATTMTFGAGLTGTYRMVPMYQVEGSSDWVPMLESDRFYLELDITNYSASVIKHPEIDLSVTNWSFDGELKVGSKVQVNATIKNNSEDRFYGDIYLDFGGQQIDEYSQYTTVVQAEVLAGQENVVTFNVSPASSGTKTVKAMLVDTYGSFDDLSSSGSVTIAESAESGELDLSVVIEAVNATDATVSNTHGTIYDSSAQFKATITNNSSGEYNKYVLAPLFICVWDEENNKFKGSMVTYKQQSITLAAGESKSLYFDFDNLAYGSIYSMNIYARNYVADTEEGSHLENIVKSGESKYYAIERGIITWTGDGTRTGFKPEEGFVIAENVAAVSLEGLSLSSITPSENPNTLYFLGEGETAPSGLSSKNIITGSQATNISLTDGYDFFTPQTFTADAISYERTFTQGHNNTARTGWSTIVLPFAPTKVMNATDNKQIDWFHSSSEKGKHFWVCDFVEEDGTTVYFQNAEEMLANVPYIVAVPDKKWGSKWDLRNKRIVWSAENVTVKPDGIAYTSGENMVFVGCSYRQELAGILGLNETGDRFCYIDDGGSQDVDAFHAYFINITDPGNAKTMNIAILNNETDDIKQVENVVIDTENCAVYNLNGQQVGIASELNKLPRGIYVIQGRKVMR
ncbi:MAG: C10 family peptidase [Prevotella sp.]|nr:C10 family peptidase [Prevotella sp.]